jgi:hypothetical protein
MIHCESIIVTQHQETETNRQNLRLKKQITRKSHNVIDNRRREERDVFDFHTKTSYEINA